MSDHVTKSSEIPDAPWYVTMVDPFFSGWGQADEVGADTVCIYVAPCESEAEAKIVYENAINREDQEHVRIVSEKPVPGEGQHVRLMAKTEAPKWYEEGGFQKRPEESCNGWTNSDTWNVSLWLENDRETYDATLAMAAATSDCEDFRAFAMEHVQDEIDADKVNWTELHEHYQD